MLTALRPIDSEERSVPRPRSGDTASLPDKAIDLTDQAGARVRRRAARRLHPLPHRRDEHADAERDAGIDAAEASLRRLTTLLRTSEVADDEGFFALGAVAVGMYRSLDITRARPRA